MRTNFDFTPFRRSTVGFDRLFDLLENSTRVDTADNYPPFDLEQLGEHRYRITMAVAGFSPDELDIVSKEGVLTVSARKAEEKEGEHQYLYRGIGQRAFERRFQLADFIQVRGAGLKDGLLTIELEREIPEAMMPRRIEIGGNVHQIDGKAEQSQVSHDTGKDEDNKAA